MTNTVLAVFEERDDAEHAINDLEANGYNPKDISIIMKDKKSAEEMSENTGANVVEGATSGATTGAIVGGIAGLVASFALPGLGAFFIGGPIAAALGLTGTAAATASGAATGAVAGGLLGALTGLGVTEENAKMYEERVKEGGILLAIPVSQNRVDEVQEILEDYDASDVETVVNETEEHTKQFQGHSHTDETPKRSRGRQQYHRDSNGKLVNPS